MVDMGGVVGSEVGAGEAQELVSSFGITVGNWVRVLRSRSRVTGLSPRTVPGSPSCGRIEGTLGP